MNCKIRAVLILSELRPGGMERLVVHLANGLSSKDISVLVICLQGKGQLATELQEPGIEIQELESYSGKDLTTTPRRGGLQFAIRPAFEN
jgi:hypothetical protein